MPDIWSCHSLTPCFTGPIRSDFMVGPLLEKLIVKTDLSDHFLKGSPKTTFWTEFKVHLFLYNKLCFSQRTNVKHNGLFRRSNMKRSYISFIDKNSYCEDGTLKSSSIFFLIYYK